MELPDGLVLNRLSGPTMLYYLKPDPALVAEYRRLGVHLPLILLFGDQHADAHGLCTSCTCLSSPSATPCCMTVYNMRWIQAIDQLAAHYPIDFFTESSSPEDQASSRVRFNSTDILFHRFLDRKAKACHNKTLRSRPSYEFKCPTESIRWHYTDVRMMRKTLEGKVSRLVIQQFLLDMSIIRDTFHRQPVSSRRFFGAFLQDELDDILHQRSPTLHAANEVIRSFLLSILSTDLSSNNTDGILHQCISDMINTFWASFREHMGTEVSLIEKQIQKMPLHTPFQDWGMWIDLLRTQWMERDVLIQALEEFFQLWYDYPYSEDFMDLLTRYLGGESLPHVDPSMLREGWEEFKTLCEALDTVFVVFNTMVMDLYYLTRMLKPPQGNDSPVLSLGFFGSMHVQSIVTMLQHPVLGYTIHSMEHAEGRCITFHQPIPLEQDVRAHAQGRNVSRYLRVLRNERKARNTHRIKHGGRKQRH